jgi:hypothetical protein
MKRRRIPSPRKRLPPVKRSPGSSQGFPDRSAKNPARDPEEGKKESEKKIGFCGIIGTISPIC